MQKTIVYLNLKAHRDACLHSQPEKAEVLYEDWIESYVGFLELKFKEFNIELRLDKYSLSVRSLSICSLSDEHTEQEVLDIYNSMLTFWEWY